MNITKSRLITMIKNCTGFYSVEFTKRTTGEVTRMTCRNGVKKHLKGGDRPYNPDTVGLISTYSIDRKGYRSIPVEGIISAKINGKVFKVS